MEQNRLTAREQKIWHAVKALSDTVFARIEADILRASGLSAAEFGVLSRLQDLGNGTLSQQVLGESLSWHKSRLSHQITRMERRHFVRRDAAYRGMDVVMLAAGKKALEAARPVHVQAVRSYLVKRITNEEAEALLAVFAKIAR